MESIPELMAEVAERTASVVRLITPADWKRPTPDPGWDVRTLVNHLIHWSGYASEAAARRDPTAVEEAEPGREPDHAAGGEPAEVFAVAAGRAARAWGEPGALDGTTALGSGPGTPASLVASLMIAEIALHGWDLSVALGRPYAVTPQAARATLDIVRSSAPTARSMGLFGPEVDVPEGASAFDRALAASGRTPGRAEP